MELKTVINYIKWQLWYRMPKGDLFKSLLYKGTEENIDYYLHLKDVRSNPLSRYLLGTSLIDIEILNSFYDFLDLEYNKKNNSYYTFNLPNTSGVKVPIPSMEDRKIYRTELMDLILPYMLDYPQNKKIPFHEGPYEYGKVCLNKNDTVLDLGANFGMFSAYASAKGCNVYAFEPTIETIDKYLRKTASINPSINISNYAVSNVNGTQIFTLDKKDCRCNGISETKKNLFILKHEEEKILVPTITIDKFIDDNNLKSVDFIKADIEGAERLMLCGARKTLREFEPDLSICYYHLLDDYKVLTDLIKSANPNYVITKRWKKIYAYSKNKHR